RILEKIVGFDFGGQVGMPQKVRMDEQQPTRWFDPGFGIDFNFKKLIGRNETEHARIKIILLLTVIEPCIDVPFQANGIKLLDPFQFGIVYRIVYLAVIDEANKRMLRLGQAGERVKLHERIKAKGMCHQYKCIKMRWTTLTLSISRSPQLSG